MASASLSQACSSRTSQLSFKPCLSVVHRQSTTRCRCVTVQALKTPEGVVLPPVVPKVPPPQFGFVHNAEVLNSRACMIGFFALLLVEAITGQGLLDSLGFQTGAGLGFEL